MKEIRIGNLEKEGFIVSRYPRFSHPEARTPILGATLRGDLCLQVFAPRIGRRLEDLRVGSL